MNCGIHIGSDLNTDQIDILKNAIVEIATASPFEEVNIRALEVFQKFSNTNAHLSNMTIQVNPDYQDKVEVKPSSWFGPGDTHPES